MDRPSSDRRVTTIFISTPATEPLAGRWPAARPGFLRTVFSTQRLRFRSRRFRLQGIARTEMRALRGMTEQVKGGLAQPAMAGVLMISPMPILRNGDRRHLHGW